ncbi:MFS transporter [Geodermatophilus sp. URMC 61]|uniref:MFS transporter n=1 Tax=Geodermatophilus sp. URMC 61 TaxID=3423411 RepID=UPI00406CCC0F
MTLGRPFWTFWTAAVLVNLGDGIRLAAFPLLAASLSPDPFTVGAVAAAGTLPWLLTGPVAGVLADRHGARLVLPLADAGRALVLLVLVGLLLAGRAPVPVVAAAAFLLGVGETVRDVASETVVPRLVPQVLLERANGRLSAGTVLGNEFVGPLAGGVLFAAGAALPFLVNGATTALAVLLVLWLPAALLSAVAAPPGQREPGCRSLRAGLAWLAGDRPLRALALAVAAIALADSAWFAVFVVFAEQRLGLGPAGFGALLALGAGGGLVGALLADRLVGGRRHRPVVAGSALLASVTPSLLLVAGELWAAGVVVVATSAAFGTLNVAAASLRHRGVPIHLLGRVTATWRTGVYGCSALGALSGGLLASTAGLDAPFLAGAALGAAAAVAWWLASAPRPRPAG